MFGQGKTKITMTCEKDSISIEQLSKLIEDVQKLEKKYNLDIKIEFEKIQPKLQSWGYLNNGLILTPNIFGADTASGRLRWKSK